MSLWGFTEDHQIAIADRFLTWGWKQTGQEKVVPIGILKGFHKTQVIDKNGGALLVEMCIPRVSYHMYSVPVAHQWINYFEEQCRFVQALPIEIREQLMVRLYSNDYGWCQKQRWLERFPSIRLDEGCQPIEYLIKKSRLYISTYNATTYLETMSLNIPTIIFWNPEHWELRETAMPEFEKLKSVGIFHVTPESAAKKMAEVWDNLDTWWYCEETQQVRKTFCDRYAFLPERPLDALVKIFRDVASVSKERANLQ